MPVQYSEAVQVDPPAVANFARITEVGISLDRDDPNIDRADFTITCFDKQNKLDAEGNPVEGEFVYKVVSRKNFNGTLAELGAKYPTEFAAAYSAIKSIGYAEGVALGLIPSGEMV